jgi:hypothetical protein
MLFLGLGAFFVVIFLVGGGVLTATNGGYWTLVFFAAYLVGLAVFGLPVYKSADVAIGNTPGSKSKSSRIGRKFLLAILAPLSLVLWLAFFRSEAFATEFGMHLFMIGMGVGLSLFVPLGLGVMHRAGEPSDAPESPSRAV